MGLGLPQQCNIHYIEAKSSGAQIDDNQLCCSNSTSSSTFAEYGGTSSNNFF
jgi:hypothetical protein